MINTERLLYYLLLLVFLTAGLGLFFLAQANHDLRTHVLELQVQQADRRAEIAEIKKTADLLVCMALVPQADRTTDTATKCRQQIETSPSSPAPYQTNNQAKTNLPSASSAPTSTQLNPSPTTTTSSPGPVTQGVQAVNRDVVQPVVNFIKGL